MTQANGHVTWSTNVAGMIKRDSFVNVLIYDKCRGLRVNMVREKITRGVSLYRYVLKRVKSRGFV